MTDIIFTFINQTGPSMLETDGPYGGAKCGSTNHTHYTSASDFTLTRIGKSGAINSVPVYVLAV